MAPKKSTNRYKVDEFTEDELAQASLIVARTRFWTQDVEKLLRRWSNQIKLRRKGHNVMGTFYHVIFYLLGMPAAIAASIVATGILTTFKNCNECEEDCSENEMVRLAMGIISILSVILAGLMTFLDPGGKREKHRKASDEFDGLVRYIDSILKIPVITRGDAIGAIQDIRTKFDDSIKNSPSIPERYSRDLEYNVMEPSGISTEEKEIDSVDFVEMTIKGESKSRSKGISKDVSKKGIKRTNSIDPSILAKELLDGMDKISKDEKLIKERVKEANGYDTDDENNSKREVTLPFDPDLIRPNDVKGRDIGYILEKKRREEIQKSLTKALEFELNRLFIPDVKRVNKN